MTLLEVVISIAVVSVLAALLFRGLSPVRARAEAAVCISHMRSLHTSFATYIQDKGMWPQEPENSEAEELLNQEWWLNEMAPYGADAAVWRCPSIKRIADEEKDADAIRIHYMPSAFDAQPTAPYKYATQPWLIEIAGMHGRGPNICFPDGSIRPVNDLLNK